MWVGGGDKCRNVTQIEVLCARVMILLRSLGDFFDGRGRWGKTRHLLLWKNSEKSFEIKNFTSLF